MDNLTFTHKIVFSTYVEVFPSLVRRDGVSEGFLHVCGGVSVFRQVNTPRFEFSPRMWRCFSSRV